MKVGGIDICGPIRARGAPRPAPFFIPDSALEDRTSILGNLDALGKAKHLSLVLNRRKEEAPGPSPNLGAFPATTSARSVVRARTAPVLIAPVEGLVEVLLVLVLVITSGAAIG